MTTLVAADWTIDRSTKKIAYEGDDHGGASPSYATVIDFHRWLQSLADDAVASGDDELDITNTDPLLGPLTYDTGTWIHPLLANSPAIDIGECVPDVTTVDQRGVARSEPCDIGAYEWNWTRVFLPSVARNY